MRTLYVYLGGWAFIMGMCFSGIAGGSGSRARAAFECVANDVGEFAGAAVLLWLAYSIPFVLAAAVAPPPAPPGPRT